MKNKTKVLPRDKTFILVARREISLATKKVPNKKRDFKNKHKFD